MPDTNFSEESKKRKEEKDLINKKEHVKEAYEQAENDIEKDPDLKPDENEDLDEGAIIAQRVISVDHTDNAQKMAQAGRDVEKNVLAHSLKLVFNEQVFVFRNKTIIFD